LHTRATRLSEKIAGMTSV